MMGLKAERIQFTVRTIPVAKARHRSFQWRSKDGRSGVSNYSPPETKKAESEFIALADPHAPPAPLKGPLRLDLVFVMPIPISRPAWWREAAAAGRVYPTVKPDKDNLEKLVMDAMSRSGRWWCDDKQIVAGEVRKVYGPTPETRVLVEQLAEALPPRSSIRRRLSEMGEEVI